MCLFHLNCLILQQLSDDISVHIHSVTHIYYDGILRLTPSISFLVTTFGGIVIALSWSYHILSYHS